MLRHANLKDSSLKQEYRTGQDNLVADFYAPCLKSSNTYDRAVGFFRSTAFSLVSEELLAFVQNNGKIRIICSPDLDARDIDAIKQGYESKKNIVIASIIKEIQSLLSDSENIEKTKVIATLVALNILDIKIAIRPESSGIYHEKIGIFKDSIGNAVSFIGSVNETWSGWHSNGNFESIEVFCSWKNADDLERVNRHSSHFKNLWDGLVSSIEIYDFPTAARENLCRIAVDNLEKIDWKKLKIITPNNARKPFEHQLLAIENWKKNSYKGILEHATGSGKTFTAITALKEHLDNKKPVLVLVPSKLLLRQWVKEIKEEVREITILKAGDGNNTWKKPGVLRSFSSDSNVTDFRVIVSTMQTASSDEFISKISQGDHLMIIADEVHQSGSPENSKIYSIKAGKKLGLSATPVRYGDKEGTSRMLEYFGGIVQPIFTLNDAINSDRLVKYEYYPYEVNLNAEEAYEWKELSIKISKEMAISSSKSDSFHLSDKARMLLIRRARIAKKAKAKVEIAEKILKENYKDDEKWLIYCEDQEQLNQILQRIKALGLHVNEYHTGMGADMDSTLDWYKKHGGIMVSIKCLDEGIDIPDISHALILASSQNPRQFIQRRGRVLRKAPNKTKAVIYDTIVVPLNIDNEPEQVALLKSELCRAIEFADSSINSSAAFKLKKIAIDLGLDIKEIAKIGSEEESYGR
jgi:superfamily II DNA or RNA helicase